MAVRRMSCRSITACSAPRYRSSRSRVSKRQQRRQQVRVAFPRQQVMEQDSFLQRRQRINVLHVRSATGNLSDNPLDLLLHPVHQRQHLRRDLARQPTGMRFGGTSTAVLDALPAPPALAVWGGLNSARTSACSPCSRIREIRGDCQQRVAPERKEVIVAADPLDPQQLTPDLRQRLLDLPFRSLVLPMTVRLPFR